MKKNSKKIQILVVFSFLVLFLTSLGFAQEENKQFSASELFDRAWQAHNHKNGVPNFPLAIEYYQKTIEKDSNKWNAYSNLGAIYLEQNNLDEAAQILTTGILNLEKRQKEFAPLYVNRAAVFLGQQKWKEVIADATKAIKVEPNTPYAFEIMGNAHAFLKNYEESIKNYNRAISLYQQQNLHDKLGNLYFNRGHSKDNLNNNLGAVADWDRACQLNYRDACLSKEAQNFIDQETPKIVSAIMSMAGKGISLIEGRESEATIDEYQRSIEILEDVIYVHDMLLSRKEQKYEFTITMFMENGKELDMSLLQNKQYLYLKLGIIYEGLCLNLHKYDNIKSALQNIEKSLDAFQAGLPLLESKYISKRKDLSVLFNWINNKYIDAKNIAASIYLHNGNESDENGQFEDALKWYAEALELNSEYSEAYYNRGVAYFQAEKYQLAIKDFSNVIKFNTSNLHESYYLRGHSYIKVGKNKNAVKDFEKTIQMNPNYKKPDLMNWISKNK